MRKLLFIGCLLVCAGMFASKQKTNHPPKREFRGAWIQCVNGQFQGMSRQRMQQVLTSQLNELQRCGINAILFQVRAEADALYRSSHEPWSRFLSGRQGTPPSPFWDPLQWMIEQCHQRGMELHAWINPYRAKTKGTSALAATHPYNRHPERFFRYGDQLIFDPGIPENRTYICTVVGDLLRHYDVDGLHMDDYFYPYPSPGEAIPDDATFQRYRNGFTDRGDWRRYNVNLFMKEMHDTIRAVKPWVKFGVSPFGIYRNQRAGSTIPGSRTKGLQNYDDLYADVLYWINKGWVDYNIPQVYWEIGHPTADYEELVQWWARYASGRPLFIGQDVERTVKHADKRDPSQHQMRAKMLWQRALPGISGSCQWYAAAVVNNTGNYAKMLESVYHKYPALQPRMPFIDDKAPGKVKKLKEVWTPDGLMLFWTAPKAKKEMDRAKQYVVYRFGKGEKVDLDNPAHIVAITDKTYLKLPYDKGTEKYTYAVTALDRLHNESKARKEKVKL